MDTNYNQLSAEHACQTKVSCGGQIRKWLVVASAVLFLLLSVILLLPILLCQLIFSWITECFALIVDYNMRRLLLMFVRVIYPTRLGILHTLYNKYFSTKKSHSQCIRSDVISSTGEILHIHTIPCFEDNYSYLIIDTGVKQPDVMLHGSFFTYFSPNKLTEISNKKESNEDGKLSTPTNTKNSSNDSTTQFLFKNKSKKQEPKMLKTVQSVQFSQLNNTLLETDPLSKNPKKNVAPLLVPSEECLLPAVKSSLKAVIIDPGDGDAVIQAVKKISATYYDNAPIQIDSILATHHHWDHTGGIRHLKKHWGQSITVYGACQSPVDRLTECVNKFDILDLTAGIHIKVLETPGHTHGSVIYRLQCKGHHQECLFTGDTLFLGGAGMPFEGNVNDLHFSFWKLLKTCHSSSLLFPGHEYTVRLLHEIMMDSKQLPSLPSEYLALCTAYFRAESLRSLNSPIPTVPYELSEEVQYNPYFKPVKDLAALLSYCWILIQAKQKQGNANNNKSISDASPLIDSETDMCDIEAVTPHVQENNVNTKRITYTAKLNESSDKFQTIQNSTESTEMNGFIANSGNHQRCNTEDAVQQKSDNNQDITTFGEEGRALPMDKSNPSYMQNKIDANKSTFSSECDINGITVEDKTNNNEINVKNSNSVVKANNPKQKEKNSESSAKCLLDDAKSEIINLSSDVKKSKVIEPQNISEHTTGLTLIRSSHSEAEPSYDKNSHHYSNNKDVDGRRTPTAKKSTNEETEPLPSPNEVHLLINNNTNSQGRYALSSLSPTASLKNCPRHSIYPLVILTEEEQEKHKDKELAYDVTKMKLKTSSSSSVENTNSSNNAVISKSSPSLLSHSNMLKYRQYFDTFYKLEKFKITPNYNFGSHFIVFQSHDLNILQKSIQTKRINYECIHSQLTELCKPIALNRPTPLPQYRLSINTDSSKQRSLYLSYDHNEPMTKKELKNIFSILTHHKKKENRCFHTPPLLKFPCCQGINREAHISYADFAFLLCNVNIKALSKPEVNLYWNHLKEMYNKNVSSYSINVNSAQFNDELPINLLVSYFGDLMEQ